MILLYKDLIITIDEDNTCIEDSYAITKKDEMKEILEFLREQTPNNYAIHLRSLKS